MFDLEFFLKLFPIMSKYIGVTLFISFCSLVISLAIAVIIAVSVYMKVPVVYTNTSKKERACRR